MACSAEVTRAELLRWRRESANACAAADAGISHSPRTGSGARGQRRIGRRNRNAPLSAAGSAVSLVASLHALSGRKPRPRLRRMEDYGMVAVAPKTPSSSQAGTAPRPAAYFSAPPTTGYQRMEDLARGQKLAGTREAFWAPGARGDGSKSRS